MAAAPAMRRVPLIREEVREEGLAAQVVPEQNLPDRFVTTYMLCRRANGFMVLVPDVEHVREKCSIDCTVGWRDWRVASCWQRS